MSCVGRRPAAVERAGGQGVNVGDTTVATMRARAAGTSDGQAISRSTRRSTRTYVERGALAAVCLLGLLLASRGVTNEAAVSLDGDMPHYLLNGAFFHDLLHDTPLRAPLAYARHYYARYPALTLGHHPFLPAIAQVPAFFVFGISVFSARLTTVCALVLAIAFWFKLNREIYDLPTAVLATLLFVSTPGMIGLFQVVLSEPFTLCWIILSVYFMHRYCVSERPAFAWAFCVAVVFSTYAKHLALFLFPVYLFQFVSAFGVRRLFRRSTLLAIAVMAAALLPLVPLTLKYSQWNITIVTQIGKPARRATSGNFWRFAQGLWTGTFRASLPVLALTLVSLGSAVMRRDRRVLLFVVWVLSVYAGLFLVGIRNDRFFVYWIPAFCALAASATQLGSAMVPRTIGTLLVTAAVGYQFWAGVPANMHTRAFGPAGAAGYEEAARYVVANRRGDTVLYSAAVDTGYFVFFARKHDVKREMIILRADKMLTTSRGGSLDFERRVTRREEILPLLREYGVGHVVIEDTTYPAGPLRWLQDIVRTGDFELKERIPLVSNDRRLTDATLSVYAYNGTVPALRSATLSINVPLMNDRIQVRLGDLIGAAR